jgi:hypothetical protein
LARKMIPEEGYLLDGSGDFHGPFVQRQTPLFQSCRHTYAALESCTYRAIQNLGHKLDAFPYSFRTLGIAFGYCYRRVDQDRTSTSSARVSICTQILHVRGDDAILAIPKSNGNSSKDERKGDSTTTDANNDDRIGT